MPTPKKARETNFLSERLVAGGQACKADKIRTFIDEVGGHHSTRSSDVSAAFERLKRDVIKTADVTTEMQMT